jgi:hypothetical protein
MAMSILKHCISLSLQNSYFKKKKIKIFVAVDDDEHNADNSERIHCGFGKCRHMPNYDSATVGKSGQFQTQIKNAVKPLARSILTVIM